MTPHDDPAAEATTLERAKMAIDNLVLMNQIEKALERLNHHAAVLEQLVNDERTQEETE